MFATYINILPFLFVSFQVVFSGIPLKALNHHKPWLPTTQQAHCLWVIKSHIFISFNIPYFLMQMSLTFAVTSELPNCQGWSPSQLQGMSDGLQEHPTSSNFNQHFTFNNTINPTTSLSTFNTTTIFKTFNTTFSNTKPSTMSSPSSVFHLGSINRCHCTRQTHALQ